MTGPHRPSPFLPMLVGAVVLSLVGPDVAGGEPTPIEIEMPVFEGGEGLTFFLECARAYEKERPGVKVNLYGDPRITDKVRVRILEGSYPEITNAWLKYSTLIREGKILALDEFLNRPCWEGDRTWRESFLPGSLDQYVHEGRTYGVPLFYAVNAVWYNRRMFREHGWQVARTWDEFNGLCRRIKTAGIPPLAFQGRYPVYIASSIANTYYSLAGPERFLAQKRIAPGGFDNPEFIRSLRLAQDMALNHFQAGAMGMSHTESQLEFLSGHTAMIICGSWFKSEMMGKIPEGFELGAFNLPVVPGGKGDPTAVSTHSGFYFIFKDSRHPREAADFLRFMTSRRMAGLFCRQRDITVAVRDVNEANLSRDLAELAAIVRAARSSFTTAVTEDQPGMEQAWTDAYFKLLTDKVTPERAARDLEEAAALARRKMADPDFMTVRHVGKPAVFLGALGLMVVLGAASAVRRLITARRAGTSSRGYSPLRLAGWNVALFLGPALLLYSAFVVIPSVKSFAWSTRRWDGLSDMVSVGLLNFRRLLLESDTFWIALRNNLFVMVVIPLFVLPLSLFFAACISRGVRLSRLFRVVFFFPNILGAVAATLLWMHMYNPQGGVVNGALVGLGKALSWLGLTAAGSALEGFRGFAWLSQDHLYWSLVPMSIWGACGFNTILFLAAMESIPSSLYEAAALDGASAWQQFRTVTLPLIWEPLSIAVVFMVIGGMKAFETIWLLTNQSPATQTHVIGTQMVQAMFSEFKIGEAAAIAVLMFAMVFFGTVAALRVMKREAVEF